MTLHASAQVPWDTDGNTAVGPDWLGADAGSTIPLRIETRANQPIEWNTDASGKHLEVLEEAVCEMGTYTHDWTTTDLVPGTYHCTLYLNDSFVVKKAVKVAR